MFQQLEVQLPWVTRFLLDTHGGLFRLLFAALALFVIWKEFTVSNLRRRLVLTARTLFAVIAILGLGILVLYLPLFELTAKLIRMK